MASKPTLSNLLTIRIVAIVAIAFAVFAAGAYWLVVEPLQRDLARAETRRAADRMATSISGVVGAVERVLRTLATAGPRPCRPRMFRLSSGRLARQCATGRRSSRPALPTIRATR
jgi:hypothetical protein